MVHGYHAYQDSWNALIGEELLCAREPDNLRDPFAVAVVNLDAALGGDLFGEHSLWIWQLAPRILCILMLEVLQQSHGHRHARTYVWSTSMR